MKNKEKKKSIIGQAIKKHKMNSLTSFFNIINKSQQILKTQVGEGEARKSWGVMRAIGIS